MFELDFNERRVLGVLIEKGFTTPDQYPLTLNALVSGCNQKSCRRPVTALDEESVLDTLDRLRAKGLVSLVQTAGGRTDRFRHRFRDAFDVSGPELAVIAELLLRGPQTDGELRQNSKRMAPVESRQALQEVIDGLRRPSAARSESHGEPLVTRLGPEGRRRGVRYAHLFYPPDELERIEEQERAERASEDAASPPPAGAPAAGVTPAAPPPGPSPSPVPPAAPPELTAAIEALRIEIADLREEIAALKAERVTLEERVDRLEEAIG